MGRILHLISQLETGGAQRQLSYFLSFSKRYEFEIASLIKSPPEKLFFPYRNSDVPIHYLSESNDFYAPQIMTNLRRLLTVRSYSILHCWLYQSIIQGVLAARLHNIPCIASPRSMKDMLSFDKNKSWEQRLIRKTLRMADLVLCPSNSIAVDFLDSGWIHPSRTRVVQNGVDEQHFQPASPGDCIMAVGRFSTEKAYSDFEAIAARLRRQFPSARCVVVGEGELKSGDLEFTGYAEDIRAALKNAAIYISTSRTEGMSNALLEVQSMGIPAVVRNIGSNSEVIEDGVNGFLVRTVDDYVQACGALLTDACLRAEMGKNARARILSRFSIAGQVEKIESIYSELL